MIGLESIIKVAPVLAIAAAVFVGYGEIKTEISNLQELQVRQYDQIMNQLDRLQDKIDQKADK